MSLVIPNKKWFKFSSFSCSSGKCLSGIWCATLSINFQLTAPDGPAGSVTRFCQILPLWPKNQSIWEFLRVYLVFGIFRTSLANYYAIGQIVIVLNGQNIEKLSSHPVTLSRRHLRNFSTINF